MRNKGFSSLLCIEVLIFSYLVLLYIKNNSMDFQEKVARLQNRGSSREEDINVRHRQGSLSRSNSNDTPTTKVTFALNISL